MKHKLELAKGKGFGLKDIDLNIVYIRVNCSNALGAKLLQDVNTHMKLLIGESKVECYIGDSTTPVRGNGESTLVQLTVKIDKGLIGVLTSHDLYLLT